MSLFRETNPPPEDEGFAATVVEELSLDMADSIEIDGQALDDARLDALPTIGHVGRYVLKHQLGAGGLGTVYAAIDPLLSRPIAVKMLKLDAIEPAQREALEQQLLTEARAAAGLSHPHIVTVYDAGLADQGVYVAMERLQGKDLRQLLAAGWRPEPLTAVRIVKRVADALAYAHSKGVIHCDVKPANVFMVARTQPKLLDFGIARLVQQGATSTADAGAAELGSPYYAAPEQMRGQALDARVDVYALGLVLYEMLAGQRAFSGESIEQIRQAVLHETAPSVRQFNPQVDPALAGVVAKAMARDPADRYASARHFVRALRRWTDDHEASAQTPDLPTKRRSAWLWPSIALALAGFIALMPNLLGSDRSVPAPVVAAPAVEPPRMPVAAESTSPATPPLAPTQTPPKVESTAAITAQTPIETVSTPAPAKDIKAAKDAKLQAAKDARAAKAAAAAAAAAEPAAPATPGTVQLAISPWGEVEVDGAPKGTTPPLARLTLPPGRHQITVRNGDFAPHTTTITVEPEKTVTLRHRFGS
jgi:eukaryotic-like serine/threonine-protein kinase